MSMQLERSENKKGEILVKLVLSLFVILFSLGAALISQLGVLLLPILAGFLASLYVMENGEKPVFSVIVSLLALVVDAAFNLFYSFSVLGAVLVAVLVTAWFTRGRSKAFYVAVSTLAVSLLLVAYVFLAAIYELGSFDLSAAAELVKRMLFAARESLYESLAAIVMQDESGELVRLFSDEVVRDTVDHYFAVLPSVVVIVAFALVGAANKVFAFVLDRFLSNGEIGIRSTFGTPASFAYFYIFLSIFQMFESDGSVFSVAMLNLYNVFTLVYAYVGFRFAVHFLAKRLKRPVLSGLIIIILALIFGSFALQLLSVVGIFETIAVARAFQRPDENDNDRGGIS